MAVQSLLLVFRDLPGRVRWKWFTIVLLGTLSATLELAISILFGVLLSKAVNSDPERESDTIEFFNRNFELTNLLLIFLGLICLRIIVSILDSSLKATTASISIMEYSNRYVAQILENPASSKFSSSQLQVAVIDNANQTFRWSFLSLVNMISSGLIISFLGALSLFVEPIYGGFIIVVFISILLPVILLFTKSQVHLSEELQVATNRLYNVVKNTIELKREIILYGRKSEFQKYFHQVRQSKSELESTLIAKSTYPKLLIETVFFLMAALFVSSTVNSESKIEIDQDFLIFVFCIFRLMPLLGQMSSFYSQFKLGIPSMKELSNLTINFPIMEIKGKLEKKAFEKSIELASVSYRHEDATKNTLSGGSILISKGEKIALVGDSGSGKSTLLDILMGIRLPDSGDTIIDGKKIHAANEMWSPKIAYVSQGFPNFDLNIHQSIKFDFSKDSINPDDLRDLFSNIGLNRDEIAKLLAEDNQVNFLARLSGGQNQRIALARALYSGIDFVVLDEATSNLDTQTSKIILDKFLSSNITLILVSHKATDLSGFDKVFKVDNGKIIQLL
jgi:ABC-type transport system involved in cytochrome bd biosynthesis fused ATPase/permease subunit